MTEADWNRSFVHSVKTHDANGISLAEARDSYLVSLFHAIAFQVTFIQFFENSST